MSRILIFLVLASGFACWAASTWHEEQVGLQYTMGSIENGRNIGSRSVSTTSLLASAGVRIYSFTPFVLLQYQFVNQSTEPAEVNNQNVSGDGYLLGAGLKYVYNRMGFSIGYNFLGSHRLGKKTTDELESTYSSPAGLFAKFDFMASQQITLFFIYSNLEYSQHTLAGRDYSSQGNLIHSSYGLGLSLVL